MKKSFILPILAASLAPFCLNADDLTLINTNFQDSGNNSDPVDWAVTNTSGVYVYALGGGIPAGTNVLAIHNGAGQGGIQQSFLTNETTADTFGSYTVSFDYGKRANTLNADFTYEFSLINVTDGGVLGTASLVHNNDAVTADTYAVLGSDSVTINYDRSIAAYAGDTIALRYEFINTGTQGFSNTAWIDNISVVAAIPEPSSAALLIGLASIGLVARRRRS